MDTFADRVNQAKARLGVTLRDKWHLDALLGVGGMAAVYAATHRNGKRGAVKVLHADTTDADVRSRFLREGRIANQVAHPGVVNVLDDDLAEDGSPFLVMELLEGETLFDRVEKNGGKLSGDVVLLAADSILDALAAAHDKGIVHRDIKPENLFVTAEGRVKILDFGIAHLAEPRQGMRRMTQTGAAMGTPEFMSPEQARGRWDLVGAQSDVWALGATMFTLLTGEFVHEGESVLEVLAAAMTEQARSLAEALPGAPTPLVEVVDRALQRKLSDRYTDARDMQTAVRAAYRKLTGEELPARNEVRRRPSPDETAPPAVVNLPGARTESDSLRGTEASFSSIGEKLTAAPRRRRWQAAGALAAAAVLLTWITTQRAHGEAHLASAHVSDAAALMATTAVASTAMRPPSAASREEGASGPAAADPAAERLALASTNLPKPAPHASASTSSTSSTPSPSTTMAAVAAPASAVGSPKHADRFPKSMFDRRH